MLLGIYRSVTVLKINITSPITDSHVKVYYCIHYITNCSRLCKSWNFAAFIGRPLEILRKRGHSVSLVKRPRDFCKLTLTGFSFLCEYVIYA